jgi:hypothetical protein
MSVDQQTNLRLADKRRAAPPSLLVVADALVVANLLMLPVLLHVGMIYGGYRPGDSILGSLSLTLFVVVFPFLNFILGATGVVTAGALLFYMSNGFRLLSILVLPVFVFYCAAFVTSLVIS